MEAFTVVMPRFPTLADFEQQRQERAARISDLRYRAAALEKRCHEILCANCRCGTCGACWQRAVDADRTTSTLHRTDAADKMILTRDGEWLPLRTVQWRAVSDS
jgi:hypothetical protein